jgi:ring-1,2-phenylacetyl-CoA epoxidase subunit PaaE
MNSITLEVKELKQVTDDALCIYFNNEDLTYQSGQYITLILNINGKEVRRPYSLSSQKQLDIFPFITVKMIENGEATRYLFEQIKVGDRIEALPPNGRFTLASTNYNQLFFFAAGSGISPIFSLIKEALIHSSANIILSYSNRSKESTIFYHELLLLQVQYQSRFHINWIFSNSKNLMHARLSRLMLEQIVKENVKDKTQALFYTCGPFYYMEMIFISLITLGYENEQLFKETFMAADEEDDEDGSLIQDDEAPEFVDAKALIKYANQWHQVEVSKDETILNAALNQGVKLPYSCKNGMCSTCSAQVSKGQAYMHYNQILTDREVIEGHVLICTSHPLTSELTIEFE